MSPASQACLCLQPAAVAHKVLPAVGVALAHIIIAELWVTEVGIVAVAVGSGDGLRHEQRSEEQDMIQHRHIVTYLSPAGQHDEG